MAPNSQYGRQLADRLGDRRTLWLLCGVLAVLCVAAAVRLVLLVTGDSPQPAVRFAAAERDTGAIPALFAGDTPVRDGGEDLDVARIEARLLGVLSRGDRALASIAVEGETDSIYAEGEQLSASVVVERILPRSVIVREQGELRRIPLDSLVEDGGPVIGTAAGTDAGTGAKTEASLPGSVTPTLTEDGSTGFRIERLDPGMAKLGPVAEGDVVMAVEGRPVAALLGDPGARKRLTGSDTLTVTVLRDGRELDLSLDARVLNRWLNR